MPSKKENILECALELFAQDGYNATSTSKIAQQAGVSEGLIFRHFGNKKGLLDALVQAADSRLKFLLQPILEEADPQTVIRKTIELPFNIGEEEYDFWRLQFKLKWEKEYYYPEKMQPLIEKLSRAFNQLDYEHPEQEAQLLNQILDSLAISILQDGLAQHRPSKDFLLSKYQV